MRDVLFLAHRAPTAPDRGDRIRGFHLLRHLIPRARTHLVAFCDDAGGGAPERPAALGGLASWTVVPRTKSRARAAAGALATGRPLSLTAFADPRLAAAADRVRASEPGCATYVFSGQMAQYARPPFVMDFVDLDSAKFAQLAQTARGPECWMLAREARLLGDYERRVAARAAASLFVSRQEADLFGGRAEVLENGVDTAFFDPAAPAERVGAPGPLVVFTGQMDYRPNVDAVRWFAGAALPRLPGAHFAVVGRAPTPEVRALASPGRVTVTGEVADVRGWLAAADVVVAPLKLARGVQNKVLEAMAMARPVVASPAAAHGIDHAGAVRVADGREFADAVAALLADRSAAAALGAAGRARVLARYGWDAALAPLDRLLELATPLDRAA